MKLDFGGALGGAAGGAALGSFIPGIGTLAGAGLGGLGGLLFGKSRSGKSIKDFILGADKMQKYDAFSPQQMQLHQALGGQLLGSGAYGQAFGNLQSLLDPSNEAYDRFTQPYMDQFNQQIIPGLAERFAGMGALSSSGFGQALGSAGGSLQNQIAALKAGLQQKAGQDIFGQYENFLGQKPYYHHLQQNEGLLGPTLKFGVKQGIKSYFGD